VDCTVRDGNLGSELSSARETYVHHDILERNSPAAMPVVRKKL